MQEGHVGAVREALSPERFETFRPRGGSDRDAYEHCLWNTLLCESLYPVLHYLEVALRSAVVRAGQECYGSRPTVDVPSWLDTAPPVLLGGEALKVEEAKRRLRDRRMPLDVAGVVGEPSFGFWTALFDVRYETTKIFWPRLFRHGVFAHAPKWMRSRNALSPLLNRVRGLRNRAFHYEPIWHWRDLRAQHETALNLLGWLSPEVRRMVETIDRFSAVRAAGAGSFRRRRELLRLGDGIVLVDEMSPMDWGHGG